MRRARFLTASAASLLAATLLLAGCSSDDGDASDKGAKGEGAPSSSASPSDGASEDTTEPDSGDGQTVTGAQTDVTFEVPADWEVLDPNTADVLTEKGAEISKSIGGLNDAQLKELLATTDVLVLGPNRQNIGAFPAPGTILPTEEQIRGRFTGTPVTVETVEEIDTPAGKAIRANWSVARGSANAFGSAIWVVVGSNVLNIATATDSEDLSNELLDTIIETITTP